MSKEPQYYPFCGEETLADKCKHRTSVPIERQNLEQENPSADYSLKSLLVCIECMEENHPEALLIF